MKNVGSLGSLIKKSTSTKNKSGVSTGFSNPTTWISTGNYTLNYLISGRFDRGIPLGKVSVFAGDSGAGKSYIVSGNIIKDAQAQGVYVYVFDTEAALDEDWMQALGVDTDESKIFKTNMSMIDDIGKEIATIVAGYRDMYGSLPFDQRPGMLFVIDSLGMALSSTESKQFNEGDMKGDLGRKAKQLKQLISNCVNMFSDLNIGLVATNHTYQSQGTYVPTTVVSGGSGFVYASSIIVTMTLKQLKEDEDGQKTKKAQGITAGCKVTKSRFNKPFETVDIKIPYDRGMDLYSGLFELFESIGILEKVGMRYKYIDVDTGEEELRYSKHWKGNLDGCLDHVMEQFYRNPLVSKIEIESVEISEDEEVDNIDDVDNDSVEE